MNRQMIINPVIKFSGRKIPICEVTKITGQSQQAIREAIKRGLSPFGIAIPSVGKSGKQAWDYWIYPKELYEATGALIEGDYEIIYKGTDNEEKSEVV